jgi:hypothetical protein
MVEIGKEEDFSLPLKRYLFGFPLCLLPSSPDRKYTKSECLLELQRTENPAKTGFNKDLELMQLQVQT